MITRKSDFFTGTFSKDNRLRFSLGKAGKDILLVVGLNPSSANEKKLDPTTRIIEKIAHNHGYDGWLIVNLYPMRCAKPSNLPKRRNLDVYSRNLQFIEEYLAKQSAVHWVSMFGVGEQHWSINLPKRGAKDSILSMLAQYDFTWHCLGITQSGNPIHPSPLSVNTRYGGASKVQLIPYPSLY